MRTHWYLTALLAILLVVLSFGRVQPGQAADPPTLHSFDITVSLEWNPGLQDSTKASLPSSLAAVGCSSAAKDSYLEDLQAGLSEASNYLYAYTHGRFALGKVTIDTEGRLWREADIRIVADNSYRPTADVGGIVSLPSPNTSAATGVSVTFYPGAVNLGRHWNGLGARCGAWSEPEGWRTVGHEWGHYALYLLDSYYAQFTLQEQYCTTTGLPRLDIHAGDRAPAATSSKINSVMAYQYTADRLWEAGTPADCDHTPQQVIHGESDWATLQRFYSGIGDPTTPPVAAAPPPSFVMNAPAPGDYTTALIKGDGFPDARSVARAYTIRGASAAEQPIRIIGQGDLIQGEQMTLLGAEARLGDRAHVETQSWSGITRYVYPANVSTATDVLDTTPGVGNIITMKESLWRPALRITPLVRQLSASVSQLTGLSLEIEDCAQRTKRLQVVFCPAGENCYNQVTLTADVNGKFTTQIGLADELTTRQAHARGYIYLRSLSTDEETIATYQLGGGAGSGHIGAHPPLMDGDVLLETLKGQDPPSGQDMRVLSSTALVCQNPALPAGVRGILGNPISIEPTFATERLGRPWGSDQKDPPLTVRLSYSQDLLDRLKVDERNLVLLRLNARKVWEIVPSSAQSLDMDWLAGSPQTLDGQGLVYALGYVETKISLPLIIR